jgi:signal transduction histidine kinase
VFDPFEQADNSITRRFGGLGLGLAISKNIVDLHHGKLTVVSEGEGMGATFTILLSTVAEESSGYSAPSSFMASEIQQEFKRST